MTGEEHLHARILEQLDLTREVQDEELTQIIYRVLEEAGRQEYLPLDRKTALGRELFNAFRKLDLLEEFLEDEEITEIMINGTQEHLPGEEGTALPVGQTVPVPGEAGGCDPADRGRIQPAGQ